MTDRIDEFVGDGLEANGVPGGALAIVDADRTIRISTFGESGRGDEPIRRRTPFIVCSVTKSFTALAVLQLVERGRVELEAPVRDYLPWFAVEPEGESGQVTIRTLLNQTSGLSTSAGGAELRYVEDKPILQTARTLVGEELQSPPGTEFHYSNANYVLLGAVIEAASGGSYERFIRRNILRPLGMNHTYLNLQQAEQNGLAAGHRYWFGPTFSHTTYADGLIPAGGLISTAPDMARYLRMMLNRGELDGRRVLSSAGIAALTRPATAATVGPWAKDPEVSYGMGWYVGGAPFGPRPAVFHPGGSPDFGSMAVLLPSQERGLVLLYNATPEVELPGAAGDVDRIPAGAASILMRSEPADGWSMHTYYVFFDLLVVLLIGSAVWVLVRSIRRVPGPAPGRFTAVLRISGAVLALLFGLLLLGFPILTGLGWNVFFLSVPDFALVLLVLGLLLVAIGAARSVGLARVGRAGSADAGPRG